MAQPREQISDEAYDSFLRESSGLNLDMASLPSVRARQNKKSDADESFIDPRFAPLANDRPLKLRRALTKFANDNRADREVVDVLRMGGVEDDSEGATGTCYFRVSETGDEIAIDIKHSGDTWSASVNGKRHTAATRDTLLSAISRELNNNSVRELSSAEKREVSLLCQAQGFYRGVAKYISLLTGADEYEALSDESVLDPRNARIYDEAVHACWLACHVDFSPDSSWPEFLAAYRGSRHLSAALCDGARVAYEVQREAASREALFSTVNTEATPAQPEEPTAPTYKELDELGDEELAGQFRSVRKEHAKLVRAGIL